MSKKSKKKNKKLSGKKAVESVDPTAATADAAPEQDGQDESDDPSAYGDYESPLDAAVKRAGEEAQEYDDNQAQAELEQESRKEAVEEEAEDETVEEEQSATDDEPAESGADESGKTDSADDDDEEEFEEGQMTLIEHLQELRVRLTRCIIAAMVGFLVAYPFSTDLFNMLMEPMNNVLKTGSFIYTYPPEAFFTYLKVSLVAGVLGMSPYIFYQLWCFIAPGLYAEERKIMVPIAFLSGVFFTTGALFGYYVVFPFGFEFFASFSTDQITFMPKLSEYLGFALKLLFAFGIVFEMPLFVLFLARLGMVTSQGMAKFRKYSILLSFVVSALLTPPDVFTQTLMAGPLIILYEISIIVARIFGKKPKPAADDEDDDDDDKGEDETPDSPDSEKEKKSEPTDEKE